MYSPYSDNREFRVSIPWDPNTAKGFGITLSMLLVFILIMSQFHYEPPKYTRYKVERVPLELINLGDGDGTGVSKGNLAKEGATHKGKQPQSNLHDAEIAAKTKYSGKAPDDDPEDSGNLIPVDALASNDKNKNSNKGSDRSNVGSSDGEEFGTGLGDSGSGPGKGMGFGDIEWGGGGSRTVLHKKLPKYPDGVNTAAKIRIRFTVSANGNVTKMIPLQKGHPTLENAAMEALKQWRFNPLKEDKEMYGIITFTFTLS
jgi:TonB family protein